MPPTSRYGPHPNWPAANKQFTNRDAPINAFQAAREALASGQHGVLAFHGVGGQGKTLPIYLGSSKHGAIRIL